MPQALKICPKCNKSPNLVTLVESKTSLAFEVWAHRTKVEVPTLNDNQGIKNKRLSLNEFVSAHRSKNRLGLERSGSHMFVGKYHCTADLLLILFGFSCFELKTVLLFWSNPNQSNRRRVVQWYFPLPIVSVLGYGYFCDNVVRKLK